jgi:hypothetical protein
VKTLEETSEEEQREKTEELNFKKKEPKWKAFSEYNTCDRGTSKCEATLQNQNLYEKIILKC